MPGLGRYPCSSCHYVAGNRRMLARHAVLIHSEKVFKCPVCPFITRYAANWYRHKRDLHGLTKVTNCEVCGFFANSTEELAHHKETEHPEHLQLEKYEDKYAKEKIRLGGSIEDTVPLEPVVIVEEGSDTFQPDQSVSDNSSNPLEDVSIEEEEERDDSITFSLPLNGLLDADGEDYADAENGDEETPSRQPAMSDATLTNDALRPLKVKRSYNCNLCGLLTSNPREYLYHLQSSHGEKISVYECKYCIYASKHVQKLHRHCNLVHRQLIAKDPEYQKQLEASKEKRARPGMNKPGTAVSPTSGPQNANAPAFTRPIPKSRSQLLFKCSTCPYQTRNKAFLSHHEKTVHLKRKFYRCLQCGYFTNEKARYTKHIKYHSLPKMQCEFCFFKTAYKWNMDRHMKNHENGAEGAFHCTACNFTTATKQSFKSHVTNHHNNESVEDFVEQNGEDGMNGEDESAEWEDMEEPEAEEGNVLQPDENASMESFEVSEPRETPNSVWKDGKVYQKNLQCSFCDFKAAWPFELKKHEENHRSQKKHPCPLCGMRFEHIAWLTKHLRRVHQENSQAKNIAAAFDLLKPTRRRPGKEYAADTVLPMFQEVLKQNNVASNNKPQENKSSMLSTLLNKPLQPFMPSSVNKFNSTFKSKSFASASNMSRQLRLTNFYDKPSGNESASLMNAKSKTVPTCNVCGYKTRWISELQRHMRVHSQEKPFHCPKCKYHCKWKGDLNRHLMKYHGIKVPSMGKKQPHNFPRPKMRKLSDTQQSSVGSYQSQPIAQENKRKFTTSTPARNPDQDGPLDLTLTKDTFPNFSSSDNYDPYDFESFSAMSEEAPVDIETVSDNESSLNFKSPLQHVREAPVSEDSSPSTKRKYQCPFCTFGTTTASRFHVHIVQHYNRRPFMCSVCGYNSNWEWDITKHIRLKGCRDEFHNKACVLLTDETGRRNYEKYEKYLVDINEPAPAVSSKPPSSGSATETGSRYELSRSLQNEQPKPCSYDFRNIGSNFEDTPENIVVTPDINIADGSELDMSQQFYGNQSAGLTENIGEKSYDAKWFFCKHCNFKHATKRVVISHLSIHAGIKPFRCRACGITSNWRHVIVRHVKDAHNGYMNEVEDRISYVQEGFALRLTSINASNPDANDPNDKPHVPQFGCKICPYKCDKEFYIKSHMKQHRPREGAIYRCDYCPYFVKFKKTLVRHTKLHCPSATDSTVNESMDADDVPFNQADVGDSQNDVYDFYDPQMNDSAEDSIAISFDTLNQYSNTESVSPQKIKRHVCESCPYKTDNKTQYLYHKQFHRPNPSAPFKCTVCTYWATMQHLLTQHMKVHSESESTESTEQSPSKSVDIKTSIEKSPIVDDDWAEKMSVIYVKRGDLVVKMFKCKFCPMMNKKKANVRVHQKMHGVVVNNGKFACSYCDYQCLNQGGLTNHLKIHQKVPEKEAFIQPRDAGYESPMKKSDMSADDSYATRKKFFSYFCMKCPALFKSSNDLEIHSKFHGSSLPFACSFCDYRARHRPHLAKHLTVHTPEYESKRNASQGPPVGFDNENSSSSDPMLSVTEIPLVKKIDQMLLLEASEMSSSLKKTGEAANLLQKCVFCPAAFIKTSTLSYHISLHGSEGEFKCTQCDYSVNRLANLTIHSQIHPRKRPVVKPKKPPLRSFPCPNCPAVFYKQDRYERHLNLHGKNYRFACQHCDYSVRFAANLIKHRALHAAAKEKADAENVSTPTSTPNNSATVSVSPAAAQPLAENTNILDGDEKKLMYICDRCPYFQCRKDAVQSHQRRHWYKDGFKCPYCDYTSMQSGFVQSHIKMHIQPHQLFPAQAFMKYESFKIVCKDEDDENETLLFDDQEMMKEKHHASFTDVKSKKKRKGEDGHERRKIPKLSFDSDAHDSNSSDFINKLKVPIVVLSDILSNDKDLQKWAPKLKIPKLKITKCSDSSSEKTYSKINISCDGNEKFYSSSSKSKPSLVVKISKIENCNKHEKTIYSVSTKTSPTPELSPKRIEFNENMDDSAPNEFGATQNTSADSFEESATEHYEDAVMDTEVDCQETPEVPRTEESEMQASNPENNDLISDEPFSEAVPETVDNCLSVLTELTHKEDLFLTNGENDSHLLNGLLPDELEMKL